MTHTYRELPVNIDLYPEVVDDALAIIKGSQITVGDLHGSALKLLFILLIHGFINISKENYERFVRLYNKPKFAKEDLDSFEDILSSITVNEVAKLSLLRLIGDILADRGKNDYFTLKILKKLRDNNVPLEIMISNHDAEFIDMFENAKTFDQSALEAQAASAIGLQKLITDNLVSRDDIKPLVETCYKPYLKALSYTLDENNQITIYTHGVIGIDNIHYIAQALNVTFLGEEPLPLAQTIDAINAEFAKHVQKNTVTSLLNLKSVDVDALNDVIPIDPIQFPLAHLIWNRRAEGLRRPSNIRFVHGHVLTDKTQNNIYNLDNVLAKFPCGQWNKGVYNYLLSLSENKLMIENPLPATQAEEKQQEEPEITPQMLADIITKGHTPRRSLFSWGSYVKPSSFSASKNGSSQTRNVVSVKI